MDDDQRREERAAAAHVSLRAGKQPGRGERQRRVRPGGVLSVRDPVAVGGASYAGGHEETRGSRDSE